MGGDDDMGHGHPMSRHKPMMSRHKPMVHKKPPMGSGDMGGPMMSKKYSKKKMRRKAYLDNEEGMVYQRQGNMLDPGQANRKFDDGFSRYYEDALFAPRGHGQPESGRPAETGTARIYAKHRELAACDFQRLPSHRWLEQFTRTFWTVFSIWLRFRILRWSVEADRHPSILLEGFQTKAFHLPATFLAVFS